MAGVPGGGGARARRLEGLLPRLPRGLARDVFRRTCRRGPLLLGVRHHGPGSARAVRARAGRAAAAGAARRGAARGRRHLALAGEEEMRPPVALLAHVAGRAGEGRVLAARRVLPGVGGDPLGAEPWSAGPLHGPARRALAGAPRAGARRAGAARARRGPRGRRSEGDGTRTPRWTPTRPARTPEATPARREPGARDGAAHRPARGPRGDRRIRRPGALVGGRRRAPRSGAESAEPTRTPPSPRSARRWPPCARRTATARASRRGTAAAARPTCGCDCARPRREFGDDAVAVVCGAWHVPALAAKADGHGRPAAPQGPAEGEDRDHLGALDAPPAGPPQRLRRGHRLARLVRPSLRRARPASSRAG